MSNVNIRTIQRAEKSEYLQLETVASLAAALKVTVTDLAMNADTADRHEASGQDEEAGRENNAVVLRRITSGKALLDIVCNSFSGKLDCEVEPTADNIEALSDMVEEIESFIPDPWETPMDATPLSLAARLRSAVALTAKISALEAFDVGVFAGGYTALAQVPRYDVEEGCMYIRDRFPFQPVTICRIMLEKQNHERVVIKVTDKWVATAPAAPEAADGDIPF